MDHPQPRTADPEGDVRGGFDLLDITAMHLAARTVGELARSEAETIAAELTARYRTINQPLRRLAKHLGLESVEEAGPLMEALAFLPKLERILAKSRQSELFPSVPIKHLGPTWQTRVFPTEGEHAGGVDKHAWIVGTAEALRGALRRTTCSYPAWTSGTTPAKPCSRTPPGKTPAPGSAAASAYPQSPGSIWTAGAANSTTTTSAWPPGSATTRTSASSNAPRTANCATTSSLPAWTSSPNRPASQSCAKWSPPASPPSTSRSSSSKSTPGPDS